MNTANIVQIMTLVDLDLFCSKVKIWENAKYKNLWKHLKIFAQECSSDDFEFFKGKVKFAFGLLCGDSS